MTRVFLVDDHATIRRAFSEEIEGAGDLAVCGTASSFAEALETLPSTEADVALIDVSLGREDPDGLELIRRLSASMTDTRPRWLVVSAHDDAASVERAREAGAEGFLAKQHASTKLLGAIRSTTEGSGSFPF